MLELKNIIKEYSTGDSSVRALNGVSMKFRESEFVSILGPSGCGKTTLLNIIGGLDQYTSGDLIINEISTKKYSDKDWDTYRNHSIGFVFQSYNLIPHQTVLANVELALTLSGISRKERRERAVRALKQVGLGSQLRKRPNQMSGGQMQRVAIARALVNNPDILLADEPTGALDTQTSVQIMDLLRKISREKLVIMVTHNPDLAQRYSSRIIRVVDGRIVSDSNPYLPEYELTIIEKASKQPKEKKERKNPFAISPRDVRRSQIGGSGVAPEKGKKARKRSMSFFTALSLSLNNLMTKKTRTFMTSFAGSIGIIGIALILSVSTGVNNYINGVQRDTLASYPIQIFAESADMSSLVTSLMASQDNKDKEERELDKVYESAVIVELMNALNSMEMRTNDLKAFRKYLESTDVFDEFTTAIQYSYNFDWKILTHDRSGAVIKSDVTELFMAMSGMNASSSPIMGSASSSAMYSSFQVWEEMLKGEDDELVNDIIKQEYDLIHGSWPTAYNEVVMIVNSKNELSDLSLYALGLRTKAEIIEAMSAASSGEILDTSELGSWTYEEICDMDFKLLLASETYQKQMNGTYSDLSQTQTGLDFLYDNSALGIDLKVVGIIRPNPDATSTVLSGSIGYTTALTEYVIEKTASSNLLSLQLENPKMDVLSGLPFADPLAKDPTAAEKKAAVEAYIAALSNAEKAAFYTKVASTPSQAYIAQAVEAQLSQMTPEMITQVAVAALSTMMDEAQAMEQVNNLTEEQKLLLVSKALEAKITEEYTAAQEARLGQMTTDAICAEMETVFAGMKDADFSAIYDNYLPAQFSKSTYEQNLLLLGNVNLDSPDTVKFYTETFDDKDEIERLIKEYNNTVEKEQKISYTDYVALLMSSVTTIIDAISYVLIAFVAISLVVSSIMIGIITYISVLERTKEIGILRAIGASKKDISRVFNAETLIIGFVAGMIGIVATLGLNMIINVILFHFTQIASLKASLPVVGAVVLVTISMLLTFIAGLFPAGIAAKKNPVEALRTE